MWIFDFIAASLPLVFAKQFGRWTFLYYNRVGFEGLSESALVILFRLIGGGGISYEIWDHCFR